MEVYLDLYSTQSALHEITHMVNQEIHKRNKLHVLSSTFYRKSNCNTLKSQASCRHPKADIISIYFIHCRLQQFFFLLRQQFIISIEKMYIGEKQISNSLCIVYIEEN